MARPKQTNPTPAELEVLQILWTDGPATVRRIMERLDKHRPRGYTTVMSLMDVMHEKGLLKRKPDGRAFVYSAKADQTKTLKRMVGDLLRRAFEGSSTSLVAHLLDHASPSDDELHEIRKAIEMYDRENGGNG